MSITCPKCGHVNAAATGSATEACPACGVIYSKARAGGARPVTDAMQRRQLAAEMAGGGMRRATPAPEPAGALVRGVLTVLGVGALCLAVWWLWFRVAVAPDSPVVRDHMAQIHDQVVQDALRQYEITTRHGTPVERCVHAGLVSAALLQANKEELYAQWKQREAQECAAAGVPR